MVGHTSRDTRTTRSYGILREGDPHGSVDIAMLAAADDVCRIVAEGLDMPTRPHIQIRTPPTFTRRNCAFPLFAISRAATIPFWVISASLKSIGVRIFLYIATPGCARSSSRHSAGGSTAYAREWVVCLLLPLIRICAAIRWSLRKISMVRAVSRTSTSARAWKRTSAMTSKALPGRRCANDRLYIGLRPRF